MSHAESRQGRPEPDRLLQEIADYALSAPVYSAEAWQTARYCLLDALGCALLALGYPACSKLIGPVVPGAVLPGGARVPGTRHELDPVQAAFCIGALVRSQTTAKQQGGAVKLVNPTKFVLQTLKLVGLLNVFEVHTDETAAVKSFESGFQVASSS